MKTAEAAKGRWPEILEHFGLPPITGKNHYRGECPVCGARGKFRIDDRDGAGTWICVCGSGDGMKLVTLTQGKPFNEICTEIDRLIGNDYQRVKIPVTSSATSLRKRVLSKFSKLEALRGTSGAAYLNSRGILTFLLRRSGSMPGRDTTGVYSSLFIPWRLTIKGSCAICIRPCLMVPKKQTSVAVQSASNPCRKITIWITLVQSLSACFLSPALWVSPKASKRRCQRTRFIK